MGRLKRAAVAFWLAVALVAPGAAEDWPARPITIIVPFAPGGTTDIVARIVSQPLGERLGQNVIIENIGGAGGTLGAGQAAKASTDGYTIFMATIAHTIAPSIYKSLPYDFQKDFDPVTVVAYVPNIVIVNPAVPAKTIAELIVYIRANPGKVNYGSAGIGSTEHLSGELMAAMAKLKMVHVPYKGGAPMMADLIAGHIEMAIETSGSASAHIKSGGVRALAVSTARRSPAFPDLPTLAEAGLPDYDVKTWYGLLVPQGTPPGIRDRLYKEVSEILRSPDIAKRLSDIGAEPGGDTPVAFADFIRSETEKWTKLSKDAHISAP
ncbi:MAG TPA: tripartite tricarboxylate transporter substrate binding protein [Xanthobacteraceae bacterium]|nr:tripartite tricarboxylate transporter substrate binding protein [Xanthobacteraceae bacterium]